MSPRVRVAVLSGGRSSEHEISVASARSVLESLDPERYEAVTVEIDREGKWQLESGGSRALDPGATGELGEGEGRTAVETLPVPTESVPATLANVDVVIPVLHGPFGEDGTVQGLLELADVPYVGAGVLGSALAMDKDKFKAVMRDSQIPVTRNITLRVGDELGNPYGYPVFVKPARLGSSVGITKARSEEDLAPAVELAFRHDEKVQIVSHGFDAPDWYDYSAKYDEGGMDLIIPPRISSEQIERVQHLAVESFVAAECDGMARVDFFVDADGVVLVNELNTIPGFTATSVYAKLFEASGIPYSELLNRLVELALERHERRSRLQF